MCHVAIVEVTIKIHFPSNMAARRVVSCPDPNQVVAGTSSPPISLPLSLTALGPALLAHYRRYCVLVDLMPTMLLIYMLILNYST